VLQCLFFSKKALHHQAQLRKSFMQAAAAIAGGGSVSNKFACGRILLFQEIFSKKMGGLFYSLPLSLRCKDNQRS